MFCVCGVQVKEYQEKDKIGSKPDKNRKRGEAGKSQKQLQWREQEKLKKMQKEGPEMHNPTKSYERKKKRRVKNSILEGRYTQPQQYTVNHPIFNAHNDYLDSQIQLNSTLAKIMEQMTSITSLCKMACKFVQKKLEEKQLEEKQTAKAQNWKLPVCYDDDDDEERSDSLDDNTISGLPLFSAITPNEPVSQSQVSPRVFPTIGGIDDDILLTIKDNILRENLLNVNHLFAKIEASNDNPIPFYDPIISGTPPNLTPSGESDFFLEEEIIPMKIDQHPDNAKSDLMESLHTHDSSLLISSKINSLLDEFAGELTLLKSIPPGIDETDCDFEEDIRLIEKFLYDNSSPRPPEEFVSANSDAKIKSFSLSPILVKDSDFLMEEIDLFCTPDYLMPPGIEDDDYDSERDILMLKDLPSNNTLSFAEKESFHFDIPSFSRPSAKPPDGDTGILNIKMMSDIFDQKACMHKLMITLAPHQEKSHDLLSHRGLKDFQSFAKCPMMIHGQNNPILDVKEYQEKNKIRSKPDKKEKRYYRRFVKNYAATASPLTDILKLQQFQWNDSADKAFQALKQEIESLVTLELPDFTQPFDVTTDASGQAIGAEFHSSPLGGHSGIKATVKRFTTVFCWPNVGDDVSNFIKSCSICQQVKAPNHKPYGLLQPLPIPSRVWDDLSIDFITHLPASNAEIWYNTTHHLSIQITPFEAVYGRTVNAIHDYNLGSSTTASIDATLAEHSRITSLLKNSLELPQKKMATQANKHRIDTNFDIGEYVYLRLHDYRQESLARIKGQKLTKRYYGPYKIIAKIGEVAYRLQLPETACSHLVFHVSLLQNCIGDHQPSVEVPLWPTDHLHISTPEVVLDRKTTQMNKVKVLIKWLGHDISEATWEDEERIRFQFPKFPLNLEDEVISHEGSNDRTITGHISPSTYEVDPSAVQRPKR
nr:hypothetical protein [Tanacetum cinerariifolium]